MTKTAGIVVVSLFVPGLCIAPFAMAGPAQKNKMKAYNEEATAEGWVKGRAMSERRL